MGQQVTVETIDREYTGEVQDIDDCGALILRDETGGHHRVIFGDVTLR
jgi:biotin-(acetyl-CoA carboxylase) ligase